MTAFSKISFCFLLLSVLTGCAQRNAHKTGLLAEEKTAASGNHYTLVHKGGNKIKFTTTRPDKKDTSVLLCIAAAFTRLDDGKVDGAYAINGPVRNAEVNSRLGGGILINDKECLIFPFKMKSGERLDSATQQKIKKGKYSFFQQIQLIVNGGAEKFKDDKLFQRRAIVTFADATVAIIESKEALTLAAFTLELVELGAYNALYTDMGGWDEGWYRDEKGKMVVIGNMRSHTAKQSNWVVFTK